VSPARLTAAADEHERAVDLRREGEARQEMAQERLEERREQASERRERAGRRASSRRQKAERTRQSMTRCAKQVENERAAAGRRSEERNEQAIDAEESARQLPAVEEQADALREREAALARADEARWLGDAGTRLKAERQRD
jgi:colicin import membrane protein